MKQPVQFVDMDILQIWGSVLLTWSKHPPSNHRKNQPDHLSNNIAMS